MKEKTVVLFIGGEERAGLHAGPGAAARRLRARGRLPRRTRGRPGRCPATARARRDGWEGLIATRRDEDARLPARRRGRADIQASADLRRPLDGPLRPRELPRSDLLVVPSSSPARPRADPEVPAPGPRGQGLFADLPERRRRRRAHGTPRRADRGRLSPPPERSPARPARPGSKGSARRLTEAGKRVGFLSATDPGRGPAGRERSGRYPARRGSCGTGRTTSLARRGVVFLDPASAWIDWDATVGPRTVVYPFVVVEGPSSDRARRPHLPPRPYRRLDDRRPGQGPELDGHGGHRPRGRRPGRAVLAVPAEDPRLRRGQGGQLRRDEEHRSSARAPRPST